jgi:hypothetical protein
MKKKKLEKIDGLGPKEIAQIRTALRKVWSWSRARRIAIARATGADGFPFCENKKCKEGRVPKIYVDHIEACGDVTDGGYIDRLFVSSKGLQCLCKRCHDAKTKQERLEAKIAAYKNW